MKRDWRIWFWVVGLLGVVCVPRAWAEAPPTKQVHKPNMPKQSQPKAQPAARQKPALLRKVNTPTPKRPKTAPNPRRIPAGSTPSPQTSRTASQTSGGPKKSDGIAKEPSRSRFAKANLSPYRRSLLQCQKMSRESLRRELLEIAKTTFTHKKVNFQSWVDRQWAIQKLDELIDEQVRLASKRVQQETGYFERLKSSFSKTKAKAMAEKMARYAFTGEPLRRELKKLSGVLAGRIHHWVQEKAKLSINRSIECINQFLKSKYHHVVQEVFRTQLATSFQSSTAKAQRGLKIPSVLSQRTKSLAGIGLLVTHQIARVIARRIAKRIASRIAKSLGVRIVSRIGTKFIPWVGWGLLIWDVIDLARAKGAAPEIEKSLLHERVKKKMRQEIATTAQEAFESNYRSIVRQVSDAVFGVWIHFQKRFQSVLVLADRDEPFRKLLQSLEKSDQLFLLVRMYGLLGEKNMRYGAKDGTLLQVIENPMREELMALLRYRSDIREALAWYRLAGTRLQQVVAFEIYKHKRPQQLNTQTLDVLLSVSSNPLVSRMLLLPQTELVRLSTISTENRKQLIGRMSANQLKRALLYLSWVQDEERNEMISLLLEPALEKRLHILQRAEVVRLIEKSPHRVALVRFFLQKQLTLDWRWLPKIPIQAYFVKFGQTAYLVLGLLFLLVFPLALFLLLWLFRLMTSGYRFLFALLRSPKQKEQ